ncbi:hypothetical protein JTB14_035806 [Gonioctena quinquepunctata]|nr:hypothetical protein JTB14_035806 [Gonioctena quinquepunctata]
MEPKKGNATNKSNPKNAQMPSDKTIKIKNKEMKKKPLSKRWRQKSLTVPKQEEKVAEKAVKVQELQTAHPQILILKPDSDIAQALTGEIETSTLPSPTSRKDTEIATLLPSTELGGTKNVNTDQKLAILPPPVAEIDNLDTSTPPPPETTQGDIEEIEIVNIPNLDSSQSNQSILWSEQSDEHNKELMDKEEEIKKHIDGTFNIEVSGLLNESDYSSSDTSASDIKLQSADEIPEMSKSRSTVLEDRRPLVPKVVHHSDIYTCRHCEYDQPHNITIDEEIRRPRDLFVLHDYTWICHSCEGKNTERIKTPVFPGEEEDAISSS